MQINISCVGYEKVELEGYGMYFATHSPVATTPWTLVVFTPAYHFEASQDTAKTLIGVIVPVVAILIIASVVASISIIRFRAKVRSYFFFLIIYTGSRSGS